MSFIESTVLSGCGHATLPGATEQEIALREKTYTLSAFGYFGAGVRGSVLPSEPALHEFHYGVGPAG